VRSGDLPVAILFILNGVFGDVDQEVDTAV